MSLSDLLRRHVLNDASILAVSRASGVPQPTLQEFAVGKKDGCFADLRLSTAEKLIDYYGLDTHLSSTHKASKVRRRRMLLVDELKACECNDSPEKFRVRLIEGLIEWFPDRTIDGLVCSPLEAIEYCLKIREGVGSDSLHDAIILKSLMNIRKRKDCPRGLKSSGTRRLLQSELEAVGCKMPANTFKQAVVDCLADMYKSQTIDELLCHPREAHALCNYVRLRLDCQNLSDQLILSTLMNVRKAGGN